MNEISEVEKEALKIPQHDYFSDYQTAYNFAEGAQCSHQRFWRLIDAIEQHIDGKKPFPQAKLQEMGMGWAYNFNHGKGRAFLESNVAKFVANVYQSIGLGFPVFRLPKSSDARDKLTSFLADPNATAIVSSAIGCAFSEMLETEGRLTEWVNITEYLSYTYGYAPIIFDQDDWIPQPQHLKAIAFPAGTTVNDVKSWVTFGSISALDLYDYYVDAKNKSLSEDGYNGFWNIEALEEVLCKLFRGELELPGDRGPSHRPPKTWLEILPSYINNPSVIIGQTSDLNIAKIFYQEMDGNTTELYIPWNCQWPNKDAYSSDGYISKILYKRHHAKLACEMISFIRDSGFSSTGELANLSGVGRYVTEDSLRYDKTRNNLGNKSLFAGSPFFEQPSTQTGNRFKLTIMAGFTMMPAGAQFPDKQPSFSMAEHIGLLNFEEQEFQRTVNHFSPSVVNSISSRPTKDEIQIASIETSQAKSAKDIIKIQDYGKVLFQILKRLGSLKLKKVQTGYAGQQSFFKLVKKYLPDLFPADDEESENNIRELIDSIESYSISMPLGDSQTITLAIQMAETPFGRNRYRRAMLLSQGVPRKEVDILIPLYADKFRSLQDDRIAAFENEMFWSTNEIIFQMTDDHIIHCQSHIAKLTEVIQQARQGQQDIVKAYNYCLALGSHTMQHIGALIDDITLKNQGEEFMNQMKQINEVVSQMAYAAQKQQKQQEELAQQQSQISPKDQADINRKNQMAQADLQREDFKAQGRMNLSQQREEHRHEEKLIQIQNDFSLDQQRHANNVASEPQPTL